MKAYVLLNVRAGQSSHVVNKLRQVEGVESANACWGRPDVFALVEAKDDKALANNVLDTIQKIDGVESTDTHILID